jgi:hypothetical protein
VHDEPFFVMDGNSPDVAAQGGTFLVVSSDAPSTDQFRFPFAQRVSADGTLVGSAVQLGSNFSRFARVAPLGSGWVAVWQRNFTHDNPNSIANAALVAADGTASPEFLVDGAAGFGGASRPNVASSGDEALLVWQDDFTGLAARRVTAGGQLTGAFAVAPLPALPALPDAIWNGEEYVVVWQDYRAQVGLWDYRTDVYAARVSESGALQDGGGGVAIANGIETELLPAVTGALGSTLFAYDELLPEAPYATLVVRVRRESPWANLGGGVGGPLLLGQGELAPGQTMSFHVASAPAGAFGVHLFGISELSLPFLGGTLVPSPLFDLGFTSDVDGAATLDLPIFSSVPSGTELFVQSWVVDLASPTNVAGTNAVRTSVP